MSQIRTWRVGEVGVEGTRRVEEGGVISIGGKLADGTRTFHRYHLDRLLPLVGEIVHFHDDDDMRGGIMVYRCRFESTHSGKEKLITGPVLGRAFEIRDEVKELTVSPRSVTNIDMAKKKSKEPEKKNPGRPRTLPKELDTRMQIRCAKTDEDAWKAHALDLGFPNASAWIRKTLNDAMKAQQAE